MGTLIALNSGAYQHMGYTHSCEFYGPSIRIMDVPVLNIDGKVLLGINDNQALLQYFMANRPQISDVSYKAILAYFQYLGELEAYKRATMLMITITGEIFIWDQGDLIQVDGDYMAIGRGSETALGCLFGNGTKSFTSEQRVEQALDAVREFHPSVSKSSGMLKI